MLAANSVVLKRLAWKQGVGKPEIAHIPNPHGVQNTPQMVDFMLDDARMKIAYMAVYRRAVGIESLVAQGLMARHPPTHAGNG